MADPWAVASTAPVDDGWGVVRADPTAGQASLQPRKRTLGERFTDNVEDAFRRGSLIGAAADAWDVALEENSELARAEGRAGKPDSYARQKKRDDADAYQLRSQSDPWYKAGNPLEVVGAGAATLAGQIAGALPSPESWVGVGKNLPARMASNAVVAGATDPAVQGLSIEAGAQDQYDPWRTVASAAIGATIPAAAEAAVAGARGGAKAVRAGGRKVVDRLLPDEVLDAAIGPDGAWEVRSPVKVPANDWGVVTEAPVAEAVAKPASVDDVWTGLVRQESGGDQSAVSPKGAFGRAQLMPETAEYVARKLGDVSLAEKARTDPAVNERLGRAYYQEQLDAFDGDHVLAAAAYNAGPGRVRDWLRTIGDPNTVGRKAWVDRIPFDETRNYVRNVARDFISGEGPVRVADDEPPFGAEPTRTLPPTVDERGELVDLHKPKAEPANDAPDITDRALEALRAGKDVKVDRGPTLMEYLARNGGLADMGGELRALDAERWHRDRPFMPRLIREEGLSLGDAAVRAQEAGFLPERFGATDTRATPQDLVDAIFEELRGKPKFAREDLGGQELRQHVADLDEVLGHLGLDPARHSNIEIRRAIDRYFSQPERVAAGVLAMRSGPAAEVRARLKQRGKLVPARETAPPLAAVADDRLALQSGSPQGTLRDQPTFQPIAADQTQPFKGESVSGLADRLKRSLGLTHRQGRITSGRGVKGEYDLKSGVVRTRLVHELDVLAHEGGHALEFQKHPTLTAALQVHDAELRPMAYSGADPSVQREEGFAEFFRLYVTNPEAARRQAPRFYASFEAALGQDAPPVLADLKGVQTSYQQLLRASSMDVAAAEIAHTGVGGPLSQASRALKDRGFGGVVADLADKAYTAFIDDLHPIAKAVKELGRIYEANTGARLDLKVAENPYALARLSREAYAAGHIDAVNGVVPYKGVDPSGPSLVQALETAKLKTTGTGQWAEGALEQFDAYLVSRRVVKEYDRFEAGELQRAPHSKPRAFHEQVIADSERLHPTWADAAEQIYRWNENLWKKEFDAGLISQETYEKGLAEHPDYVPLNRDVSDKAEPDKPQRGGKTLQHAGGAKTFRGSNRDVISPLTSMMRRAYELNALIKRNEVLKTLDDLAQRAGAGAGAFVERLPKHELDMVRVNGREALENAAKAQGVATRDLTTLMQHFDSMIDPETQATIFRRKDLQPKKGEAVVFVWRNGEKTPLLLADGPFGRDLFQAIAGMSREMQSAFLDVASAFTQTLRTGVTLSPEFMARNVIRDQIAVWINTDVGYVPGYHFVKGAVEQAKQGQLTRRYAGAGGMRGGLNTSALKKPLPKTDPEAQAQLRHLKGNGFQLKVRSPLAALATLTDLSEGGSRLGVMGLAYKKAKARGLNDYEAVLDAAYTSRDYLDFGRRGARMLSAVRLVTFLNAALQSLDKTARVLSAGGNLKRVLAPLGENAPQTATEKRALAHAYKAWAKLSALAVFGGALRALYADDDEYNDINDKLRATHWWFKALGKWIAIPKPFELAQPSNIVERAFEGVVLKDPRMLENMLSDLGQTMLPPHGIPILTVPFEIARNRNFQDAPIVPDHLRGTVDPALQFNSYTSWLGKKIGEKLGVSPAVVDHVITGMGGSLGRYALQGSTMAYEKATGAPSTEAGPEDIFLSRAFVKEISRGSNSQGHFWDLVARTGGKLTEAEGTYRSYLREVDDGKAAEYLNKLSPQARAFVQAKVFSHKDSAGLHPLVRAQRATQGIGAMRRFAAAGELTDVDEQPIALTPAQRRRLDDALAHLSLIEMRNALILSGEKGWERRPIASLDADMAKIAEVDPRLTAKLAQLQEDRRTKAYEDMVASWAEQRPILEEKVDAAWIKDMNDYKRRKSTNKTAKRQQRARDDAEVGEVLGW